MATDYKIVVVPDTGVTRPWMHQVVWDYNYYLLLDGLASNSRPSLLGLVQLANACTNLFPRFWGIRIFLSKLIRILSKKGRSVW